MVGTKWRTVKRLRDGTWYDIKFEHICAGDRVQLYEADGTLVTDCMATTGATPEDAPPGNYGFTGDRNGAVERLTYRTPSPSAYVGATEPPPLGLRPERFARRERMIELLNAMSRFTAVFDPFPGAWIDELDRLNVQAKIEKEAKRVQELISPVDLIDATAPRTGNSDCGCDLCTGVLRGRQDL